MNKNEDVNSCSNQEIAVFVNEAQKMEERIVTLRELAKKAREQSLLLLEKAKEKLQAAQEKLEDKQEQLNKTDDISNDLYISLTFEKKAERYIKILVGFPILYFCLGTPLFIIVSSIVSEKIPFLKDFFDYLNNQLTGVLILTPFVLPAVLVIIHKIVSSIKEKKKIRSHEALFKRSHEFFVQTKERRVPIINKQISELKFAYDQATQYCNNAQAVSKSLLKQAEQYDSAADKIQKLLDDCLENTLVFPEEYSDIDCIITANHVIKNDLGNSIDDVLSYYEDNHIDSLVVCGINDIYIMLQDLAEKMTEAKEFLNRISDNVKTMSDDMLENIKTALEKQQKNVDDNKAMQYSKESCGLSQQAFDLLVKNY